MKTKGTCHGVGINDADYKVGITCPFYKTWAEMLRRGYSEYEKLRHPSYKDVSVCAEWHRFSTFKAWMEVQPWQGNDLDKDILLKDNSIYSPATCVFVPSYINTLLVTSKSIRGNWPLGVSLMREQVKMGRPNIFRASIKNKRSAVKQKNLGQLAKAHIMQERLVEYSLDESFNVLVFNAIHIRSVELRLYAALGKETVSL